MEPTHFDTSGFVWRDGGTPPQAAPELKPIESFDQFVGIFNEMKARNAAERATAEQRNDPARIAAQLAERQHRDAVAQVHGIVRYVVSMLERLEPPPGTREALMVRTLLSTIAAFRSDPVPLEERVGAAACAESEGAAP